ncbi:substrate-binding domain-containing protein [Bacillus sp. ISL-75]|uniref:substrate-binding domain-containing protein n=1 Tax=Bacillus sp. ISL-75 TaxID=2819137 RepID=UPI001BE8E69D|nr:substrate-binding domain-containing protein [Bacillus sp. ISL-75]MBT2729569.1 substrate-binding domain-containing protein [Bacillus sp. ISL-75]
MKTLKKFTLLGFICLVIAASVGCQSAKTEVVAGKADSKISFQGDKKEVYYVISFLSGLDYWKGVFGGFQKAGNQFGVETKYTGDPGYDINKSVAVFEQIVATKPAGIAVAAINADALKGPINKAREQGIQVVTYDSDSPDSNRAAFFSTGNEVAGEKAADYMAKLMGEKGEVALLYTIGQQNVEDRIKGFQSEIKDKYPNMKVVVRANDGGDQTKAAGALSAELQGKPNIKGVFAADGVAGLGAATAVREAGKKDKIKIIGFDTDKALLDMVSNGEVDATMAQGTENMGYWSMVSLFTLKHDLAPKTLPKYVDTGISIVTKKNVKDYYAK